MDNPGEDYDAIPVDEILSSLSNIIDCRRMKTLLLQRLDRVGIAIGGCEVIYVRYKPNTNCLIAYKMDYLNEKSKKRLHTLFYAKVFDSDAYAKAAAKAGAHRWVDLTDFPPYIILADQRTIVYFFPNDSLIDGLRLLSDPKKIQRVLYQYCKQYPEIQWRISDHRLRIETLRYKPERRAVIACRTRAINRQTDNSHELQTIIRIYADGRGEKAYDIQKKLHHFFSKHHKNLIPYPICYLPDRKSLFMERAHGQTLLSPSPGELLDGVRRTAGALAQFHNCDALDMNPKRMPEYLNQAASSIEMTSSIAPEIAELANKAFAKLKSYDFRIRSEHEGLVHGDFYYSQVLIDKSHATLIDFDRTHIGDIVSDLGNFCAHLKVRSIIGPLAYDDSLQQAFIESYEKSSGRKIDPAKLKFWIAYSLMQLSVGPFRRFEKSWKIKTRKILEECLNLLEQR